MTPEEAIKILTLVSTEAQLYRGEAEREAQKLGIEALKEKLAREKGEE